MIDEIVQSCVELCFFFFNRVYVATYSIRYIFMKCSKVLYYPSPFIIFPRPYMHVPKYYLPLTEAIVIYCCAQHVILD